MTEPAPAAPQPAAPLTEAEDKQWASFAHFGNIILLVPALIIYLVFKDRGPKVAVEGKEALNWTINVTAIVIIGNILSLIIGAFTFGIGSLLLGLIIWAVIIVNIIFAIMGGVKVNGGGSYRYPVNIRWIK
jgi:uncharacterized Tic20 family protein